MFTRSLASALIGITALFACSSEPQHSGSAVAAAGSGNAAAAGSGNAAAGSTGAGHAGSGVVAGAPNLNVDPDASSPDSDAGGECSHLNIGIIGTPGANASSNFQQWLVKSGTTAQRIQTEVGQPLTAATLEPFDVLVIDQLVRPYTAEEAATFAAWVSAGGGVVCMSGYEDNTDVDWRANSLLAPLQVAYGGSRVNGPVTDFVTSPITTGINSVTFVGGYPISDLGGNASTRTPIAFAPDAGKEVVGLTVQMGKGRAVIWGDEWIEFDSEWSTQPQITQLWVQLFAWIAPQNKCELTPPK